MDGYWGLGVWEGNVSSTMEDDSEFGKENGKKQY
jgi:hypothetical protein